MHYIYTRLSSTVLLHPSCLAFRSFDEIPMRQICPTECEARLGVAWLYGWCVIESRGGLGHHWSEGVLITHGVSPSSLITLHPRRFYVSHQKGINLPFGND